jgi:adenine-specific DNA methylase
MKYMGSKKWMLNNGLSKFLIESASRSSRIYDPFCGSSVVSRYIAEKTNKEVIAGDLQLYSVYLANSILHRTSPVKEKDMQKINLWMSKGEKKYQNYSTKINYRSNKKYVNDNRLVCSRSRSKITKAYGGYYFSFAQAKLIDYLLEELPNNPIILPICMAALIEAASNCVASPGHTAQPIQPTKRGLQFILQSWQKNPMDYIKKTIMDLSLRYAQTKGHAKKSNALSLLDSLGENDLVFLDPPYSCVHYSRFYHVLETIARNKKVTVSGQGRYPPPNDRPNSSFSKKATSSIAMKQLLDKIAKKKARAIITFPLHQSSNGLSGSQIKTLSKYKFKIQQEIIIGKFSTLGGNNELRPARLKSEEMILLLEPK